MVCAPAATVFSGEFVKGTSDPIGADSWAITVTSFTGLYDLIATDRRAVIVLIGITTIGAATIPVFAGFDFGISALHITVVSRARQNSGSAGRLRFAGGWAITVACFTGLDRIVPTFD